MGSGLDAYEDAGSARLVAVKARDRVIDSPYLANFHMSEYAVILNRAGSRTPTRKLHGPLEIGCILASGRAGKINVPTQRPNASGRFHFEETDPNELHRHRAPHLG